MRPRTGWCNCSERRVSQCRRHCSSWHRFSVEGRSFRRSACCIERTPPSDWLRSVRFRGRKSAVADTLPCLAEPVDVRCTLQLALRWRRGDWTSQSRAGDADQRLLPLAANWPFRPQAAGGTFQAERPHHPGSCRSRIRPRNPCRAIAVVQGSCGPASKAVRMNDCCCRLRTGAADPQRSY